MWKNLRKNYFKAIFIFRGMQGFRTCQFFHTNIKYINTFKAFYPIKTLHVF